MTILIFISRAGKNEQTQNNLMSIELSADFKKFLTGKMTVQKLWEGLRGFLKFQHIASDDISLLS